MMWAHMHRCASLGGAEVAGKSCLHVQCFVASVVAASGSTKSIGTSCYHKSYHVIKFRVTVLMVTSRIMLDLRVRWMMPCGCMLFFE
eukprot:UN4816